MKYLLVILLLAGCIAKGDPPPIEEFCKNYPGGEATSQNRLKLLSATQKQLTDISNAGEIAMKDAANCYSQTGRSSANCQTFRKQFGEILAEQIPIMKTFTALATTASANMRFPPRHAMLNLIMDGDVSPTLLGNFPTAAANRGYPLSNEDRQKVNDLWKHQFLTELHNELVQSNYAVEQNRCRAFVSNSAQDISLRIGQNAASLARNLAYANPMLENIKNINSPDETIRNAFLKAAEMNASFRGFVQKMKTDHPDTTESQLNLATVDHEMGLVNFPNSTLSTLQTLPDRERANACASWQSLVEQQAKRRNTSVTVGYVAAGTCGVGLATGLVPLCLPAAIDSAWGFWQGFNDADIARASAVAGVTFRSGQFSGGIRKPEEAAALGNAANIVMGVNALTVIPIFKGLRAARIPGTAINQLIRVPITDGVGSLVEINASNLASIAGELRVNGQFAPKSKPEVGKILQYQADCLRLLGMSAPTQDRTGSRQ